LSQPKELQLRCIPRGISSAARLVLKAVLQFHNAILNNWFNGSIQRLKLRRDWNAEDDFVSHRRAQIGKRSGALVPEGWHIRFESENLSNFPLAETTSNAQSSKRRGVRLERHMVNWRR
jgi:hypothetical protein